MAVQSALTADAARDAAQAMAALVAGEASATHPHLQSLLSLGNAEAARNAADALHYLSLLHGRHPGVIDHAAMRIADNDARKAMFAVADAFARERELLGQLVVAAGPIPSTPGQAESEASVVHQHHAIDMLAQSERQGCAAGAAVAVALDWHAVRGVLAACARRFGVEPEATTLPSEADLVALARQACPTPATERAMQFGAQQIATQHRGLWDLLEARSKARQLY